MEAPAVVVPQQCVDVQRRPRPDHPEQPAAHAEPSRIDGGRRLDRELPARRAHRGSELNRLDGARDLEVPTTRRIPSPITSTRDS